MVGKTVSFAKLTLRFRHNCVRILAPKLWQTIGELAGEDSISFERPMITFLKNHFGSKPLVGCEIGTREGINAARILATLNIKKLYLVDPYQPYYEPLFPETSSKDYQEKVWVQAHELLKFYSEKTVWVQDSSDNAVTHLESLDFCYIDGSHSYAQVKRDIENYGRLIRKGGVLGGHDFTTTYMGLCKAVIETPNPNWLELQGKGIDWWMVKI